VTKIPQGVEITILGTKYTVVSDRDDAYVRSLAQYLDEKLAQFREGRHISLMQSVILVALNIADELFNERSQRVNLFREIEERSSKLIASLEDSLEPAEDEFGGE
jgi:cell division protein ZapA